MMKEGGLGSVLASASTRFSFLTNPSSFIKSAQMGGRKNKAMKKLLFIAACAAGMIAVADVQSANIVG